MGVSANSPILEETQETLYFFFKQENTFELLNNFTES